MLADLAFWTHSSVREQEAGGQVLPFEASVSAAQASSYEAQWEAPSYAADSVGRQQQLAYRMLSKVGLSGQQDSPLDVTPVTSCQHTKHNTQWPKFDDKEAA
jgi:hypothetical protein